MRVSSSKSSALTNQVVSEDSNRVVDDELLRSAQTISTVTNNNPKVQSIMNLPAINLPPVDNKDAYISFPNERTVCKVLEEVDGSEELKYRVRMGAGHTETVSSLFVLNILFYFTLCKNSSLTESSASSLMLV